MLKGSFEALIPGSELGRQALRPFPIEGFDFFIFFNYVLYFELKIEKIKTIEHLRFPAWPQELKKIKK